MVWRRPKTRLLYRLYNPTTGDHLYTTDEGERSLAGYVEEGITCRLLEEEESGTVPFWRLNCSVAADHAYAATDARKAQLEKASYDLVEKPLGSVYTAQRGARTVRLFELQHSVEQHRHFYTCDKEEADRVAVPGGYKSADVICHALPPPMDARTKGYVWGAISVAGGTGLGLAILAWKFGGEANFFQNLVSAWGLIGGVVTALAGFLVGLAVGRRPFV